jgi:hypothetical protein
MNNESARAPDSKLGGGVGVSLRRHRFSYLAEAQ